MWCVGFPGMVLMGGGVWCGAGLVRCPSCVGALRCPMSPGPVSWCVAMSRAGLSGEVRVGGGEGSAVWCCGAWSCLGFPFGGNIVSGSGEVGGCSWLVLGRCRAVPRRLLVVSLVFPSLWALWDLCSKGLRLSWGAVCGLQCRSKGGVVAW